MIARHLTRPGLGLILGTPCGTLAAALLAVWLGKPIAAEAACTIHVFAGLFGATCGACWETEQ
jgi:hypothetical protein